MLRGLRINNESSACLFHEMVGWSNGVEEEECNCCEVGCSD